MLFILGLSLLGITLVNLVMLIPLLNFQICVAEENTEKIANNIGLEIVNKEFPGYSRKKLKVGYEYKSSQNKIVKNSKIVERIDNLKIPPAWENVWICETEKGHLQAVGRDAKKRMQYIYHPLWTKLRREAKFDKMIPFARSLHLIRKQYENDLKLDSLSKSKVIGMVVKLMDATFIRIGSEEYAQKNDTYGLSTLREKHMKVIRGKEAEGELDIIFEFTGKSGKSWVRKIEDDDLAKMIIESGKIGGTKKEQDLFMFEDEQGVARDIKAEHVNEYLTKITNEKFTAKDFRTWGATYLAGKSLSEMKHLENDKGRKKNITRMVKSVSEVLGNTPAVCRGSYIHPVLINDYLEGEFENKWNDAVKSSSRIKIKLNREEKVMLHYLEKSN